MVPTPNIYSLIASCMVSLQNPNNAGKVERRDCKKREATFKYDVVPNLEEETIMMLADVIGYDRQKAGGNIVSGGTMGMLTALLVARDKSLEDVRLKGLFQRKGIKVITSRSSHFAIRKAVRILGIGEGNLIEVPVATDEQISEFKKSHKPFPLKPDDGDYEQELEECEERGESVIAVIPTVGTTGAETIEPVSGLVKLRDEYGFQLIVDAAFGGFARLLDDETCRKIGLTESPAEKMKGIEESDAVIIDPHKWGYVQYPAGAVLFRDYKDLELLEYKVPYYEPALTIEGSRPGGPIAACWVALKTLGKEGYIETIGNCIKNAKYLEKRLREEGHHPVHEVDLNVVNFDAKCDTNSRKKQNELNERVKEEINKRGKFRVGFIKDLSGIKIDGEPLSTVHTVFMNPYTNKELIDEFVEELNFCLKKVKS
jgi:glutamate/tyrosine decarboxylase-like PLP-dependent enzyme